MPRSPLAPVYAILGLSILVIVAVGAAVRPADQLAAPHLVVPSHDPIDQAADTDRYAAVPPDVPGFIGARVGATDNQLSTDAPLTFSRALWDTAGLWDPSEPSRLTIPVDGFYSVQAQITVLGSGYPGSPPAESAAAFVIRNGDPDDFVCADSDTMAEPTVAQLYECSTTDWFLAGDYLEVVVTANRMVESNWPGRGNVSPILLVVRED